MASNRTPRPLFRTHRICAVAAAPTAAKMIAQVRSALEFTRTIELRLDWMKNQHEIAALLAYVPALRLRATLIATCRRREAAGKFAGGVARQLACLVAAGALGCQWCDLEIESVSRIDLAKYRRFFPTSRLLVSCHDFERTPGNLNGLLRRLVATGADAVKIATECRSIADSLRVLNLAHGRRNVIAVPMSEAGLPARVLALREGSALAYASAGPATAPGQLSLEEMQTLYRADQLDRRTKVYGVIGNPIGHSLSPLLHNTGFIERRMNAVYLPFPVRDLRDFLAAVKRLNIAGFSVTLPHKLEILKHLDRCEAAAEKIGAVNTVVVKNGKLHGYNTDCLGILKALSRRMRIRGKRVLILGAGGAARAAAFGLSGAGAAVCICSRRPGRGRALAREVKGETLSRRHVAENHFDVIVHATPVGLHPRAEDSPLRASELDCQIVFDLVYRPLETELLRLARRRGIQVISGVEMFIEQGVAQWELWHGERAPVAAMRAAVLRALKE